MTELNIEIRDALRRDHEFAVATASHMHASKGPDRRKALLSELVPALVAHSRAKEAHVYRPLLKLRRSEVSHAIANEGVVEQSLIEQLLKQLDLNRAAGSESWKAQAKVLLEILRRHFEREDQDLIPHLTQCFEAQELVAMGVRFVRAKETILSSSLWRWQMRSYRTPYRNAG